MHAPPLHFDWAAVQRPRQQSSPVRARLPPYLLGSTSKWRNSYESYGLPYRVQSDWAAVQRKVNAEAAAAMQRDLEEAPAGPPRALQRGQTFKDHDDGGRRAVSRSVFLACCAGKVGA